MIWDLEKSGGDTTQSQNLITGTLSTIFLKLLLAAEHLGAAAHPSWCVLICVTFPSTEKQYLLERKISQLPRNDVTSARQSLYDPFMVTSEVCDAKFANMLFFFFLSAGVDFCARQDHESRVAH